MNNKCCGCSKSMPSKGMPRMQRGMSMKPACNSCKGNNWSNSDIEEDYNKLDRMIQKNKEMAQCGCRKPCGCQKSCENPCQDAAATCRNKYEGTYPCTCKVSKKMYEESCPLQGRYGRKNSSNECPLYFATEVDELPLGMGYVPFQEWNCNVSNACQGLCDGTIFPELIKPFGCDSCCEERRGC